MKRTNRPNLEALEARRLMAAFLVTKTDDSGPGTLRQAILDSNSAAGANSIGFNIAAGGFQTITPTSPLPTITVPVTIDGSTEPGYAGTPLVGIDGSKVGVGGVGLRITAGDSTVRGLEITHFLSADLGNYRTFGDGGFGIELADKGGNVIEGDYLGIDGASSSGLGNGAGIHIVNSPGNTIGGITAGTGNVISGNMIRYADVPAAFGAGIVLDGAGSTGNLVAGNLIGTDVTGTRAVANGTGILFSNAVSNTIGGSIAATRNVISANTIYDLWLRQNSNENVIASNYIETDKTGMVYLTSTSPDQNAPIAVSINLEDGSSGNTIGGSLAVGGNVIEPKTIGISLTGPAVTGNVISGNFIGVDATGGRPIVPNNSNPGILLGSPGNTIGGTVTGGDGGVGLPPFAPRGFGNVISGVGYAIEAAPSFLAGVGTNTDLSGSVVAGNFLGTDTSGMNVIGNYAGVDARGNVTGLQVGGSAALANVIANSSYGIQVENASQITIRANSIYNNTYNGIALTNGTSNGGIQAPVLLSSDPTGGTDRRIIGTVTGTPGDRVVIDFYASPTAPNVGVGQGQTYLGGGTSYQFDEQGHANFLVIMSIPADLPYVTATATDTAGNTSEFSNSVPQAPAQSDLTFGGPFPIGIGTVGQPVQYTFLVLNNGPDTASTAVVTTAIPPELRYVDAISSSGTLAFANGVLTATIPNLAPGSQAAITITAIALAVGTSSATATVTGSDTDPNPGNNTVTQKIPVGPALPNADLLSVSQTATPEPVHAGDALTYTILVRNVGQVPAEGVQFDNTPPPGASLVSAVSSQGQIQVFAGLITANLGSISVNGVVTITIVVRPITTGTASNVAQVSSTTPDGVPSNNSSTLTVPVTAPPLPEGPIVVGFQRLGYTTLPTRLVLSFSQPLDQARAQDPHNYVLRATVKDANLVYRPAQRIPISSAIYNPLTGTVTLRPAVRLNLHLAYQLTVIGAKPTGVTSSSGIPLDGSAGGQTGSNYVATFLGFHVIEIGQPPAKPKTTPHHVAAKHTATPAKNATLFGHPNVLATHRKRLHT